MVGKYIYIHSGNWVEIPLNSLLFSISAPPILQENASSSSISSLKKDAADQQKKVGYKTIHHPGLSFGIPKYSRNHNLGIPIKLGKSPNQTTSAPSPLTEQPHQQYPRSLPWKDFAATSVMFVTSHAAPPETPPILFSLFFFVSVGRVFYCNLV